MRYSAFLALLLLVIPAVNAQTLETYEIESGSVLFISKAPMETFEGKTSNISGNFSFNKSNLSSGLDGLIRVDVKSLTTENKKRDKHMFDNHLHPDDYPEITLVPESLSEASNNSLENGQEIDIALKGDFSLHGVTRKITAKGKASLNSENELEADFKFSLLLTDFNIQRPSFLIMKVADEIKIEVKFKATVKK